MPALPQPEFLPMSREEMRRIGWDELDVLLVTGDAYVDHPAFGAALLARWLVTQGLRVGVVAQPDWTSPADVVRLGRPRLFAGVAAGALDSMLAHYTAFRKKRSDDAYTPGGRSGARPNRAVIVYSNLVRQAFPGLPLVIGGIEASMRRATHYDFWTDALRRSILLDTRADLLAYGMAERALAAIAQTLAAPRAGAPAGIPGTAWACAASAAADLAPREWRLPSHEEIQARPAALVEAALLTERHMRQHEARAAQDCGDRCVVFEPPAAPLTAAELDDLYALPFTREAHPAYREPIPALDMVRFSITTHRGCAGGCAFCALAAHQGRAIASRSRESLLAEARRLTRHGAWRGSLSDVGGPTANMWGARCAGSPARCRRDSCLVPEICPQFRDRQGDLHKLLRELAAVPGVKHLRTASGVRHDLALRSPAYVRALVGEFTGGQLKLAPEHTSDRVLRLMRKPLFRDFERFIDSFDVISRERSKEQYVVPYLLSALPGCTDEDMLALRGWLAARAWSPQQVQCFIPTPGTVATAMFYAGCDEKGHPIPVARTDAERLRQHGILTGPSGGERAAAGPRPPPRRPRPRAKGRRG